MSNPPQGWLSRHAAAIQSVGTLITAIIAIAALVGVKWQIDASARIQQEQSARDIYREFLNISISKPEFARPNYCVIKGTPAEPAYEAYVDYMLYTTEQLMATAPDWEPVLESYLHDHRDYLCLSADWSGNTDAVARLIENFRAASCAEAKKSC